MRTDTLVYVSGPITPNGKTLMEDNIAMALGEFLELIKHDIPAVCVHLSAAFPSSHQIGYNTWMQYDLALLARCTHILMLDGWSQSEGAQRERMRALDLGIPILYSVAEVIEVLEAKDKWQKETA